MKKILTITTLLLFLLSSCATQQHSNGSSYGCGTKAEKKAKYKSMKMGKSPGGGMLH